MDRRSFLKGAAVALAASPAAVAGAAVLKPNGIRVSVNKDDPGYRTYCIAKGDGKKVEVYLDGKKCKYASTADEALGMVIKGVETPGGRVAHDGEYFLEETVYGDVRIIIS